MSARQKIENLYYRLLGDREHQEEIGYLEERFNITNLDVISAWIHWDTQINEYSNEVYSSEALRLVMHLHNCLKESWHYKRQELVLGYLNQIKPASICELGFGTPQMYVREYIKGGTKIMLCDFETSALNFGEAVLSFWNPTWRNSVSLGVVDLNRDSLPIGYDTYLFQDSIEHAGDPARVLKKYVDSMSPGTHGIFSLPLEVEKPIPGHNIFWKDKADALSWLETCGLKVLDSTQIQMNPEVDIFSLSLHPDFSELVVLAQK